MSIGRNISHDSAKSHVTGESIFLDDRAPMKNEVFVAIAGSPVACGTLKGIDSTAAMELEGVEGVFTAADFSCNLWGTIVHDQPLLVEEKISHINEPVCLVAARTPELARDAARLIEFEIEKGLPVFTIDEAISRQSFNYTAHPFKRGNVDKSLKESQHTLKGNFECGGQEHFYLENQASIAYPLENGQLELHSSTQHPSESQRVAAKALGIGYHQVTCIVKRMGGAFGGKESQAIPFGAYAALAASKLKRPARVVLNKDEDMALTGKRHPFKIFYEVGFENDGGICAIKVKMYSDAGAYSDLSSSILERAMFHLDGAYYLEDVLIEAKCCRTNHLSNTAFRGFGGPQGNMCIESIIEDIAFVLKKDAMDIRRANCYGIHKRNVTPYGQLVGNNLLPELFELIEEKADYRQRVKEISSFNEKQNGTLRGISCTAVKFGIAFTAKFLNQGNALVNIHLDGTVQVSTGATEMGQGVNTKVRQIVAHAFSIPVDDVQIMPTSTEKNHNTSPTAASSGSDINGSAALEACDKLKERIFKVAQRHFNGEAFIEGEEYDLGVSESLQHLKLVDGQLLDTQAGKSLSFKELVGIAYLNRVSLGAYAHYKTPGLGFDKKKGEGKAFAYFTNGVAVSEVSIDEYTGELKVLRTDILMDLGRSLNPGIDEGQVAGAFVQGMGWVCLEKLSYSKEGHLLTHSPTTYKIPSVQDIPREFNIEFLTNDLNERAVHRSKAVGEPPFLLASSVWAAAKNALSYRSSTEVPCMVSPCTNEVLLFELERLKASE